MAQVTRDMCDHIIAAADRGERFSLTVDELRQLAYAFKAAPQRYEIKLDAMVPVTQADWDSAMRALIIRKARLARDLEISA